MGFIVLLGRKGKRSSHQSSLVSLQPPRALGEAGQPNDGASLAAGGALTIARAKRAEPLKPFLGPELARNVPTLLGVL